MPYQEVKKYMKGCFVGKKNSDKLFYVYDSGRRELFKREIEIYPEIINKDNLEQNKEYLKQVEIILSTWGMESFTGEQLDKYFPNLKAVFYAAGSVRYFALPFLERGVKIISAWGAMAIPVAEFTVGEILLANKGYYIAMSRYKKYGYENSHDLSTMKFPGTYGTKVGILGAGMIGSRVIKMLKNHNVELMVFDPFMSELKADNLGVKNFSLEEVFAECQTISNHIANNAQTVGMLDYKLFSLMKDNAAFINTGRGAQVVEEDLARALKEKPDRCAILDVTWPEPCPKDHEFWKLPNVFISPHIAGYASAEVGRMADYMLKELKGFIAGEKLQYEVSIPMLSTMA
ncbi:MAG TPA: phosphoglycerate dehydrogenase [Clostridiaceae bacterium]|nr:phosphoglycerate dehydrogenase [Clostridiaceae bacterium]